MGTRRLFAPVFGLLSASAWLALLIWGQSPYGRYLDHGRWTEIGLTGAICRSLPAGTVLLPALIYAGGWLLMIAAMMLPTSLPLFRRFDRVVQGRPDRVVLLGLLTAGYLLAWAGFGLVAHLLDSALHAAARRSDWLIGNAGRSGPRYWRWPGCFNSAGSNTAASTNAALRWALSSSIGAAAARGAAPSSSACITGCSASAAAGR
jgi:hypothetical protein